MDKYDTEQKQVIVNALKAQLRRYTYEDSENEFNAEKVKTITELLEEMDPIEIDKTKFNPQSGIKRFWEHYEKMETNKDKCDTSIIEDELSANFTSATREYDCNKKSKRFVFHRNKGIIRTAVAVSLVFMVFWGISGSTMADRDTGFFHWVTRGEKGQEGIFFPTQEEIKVNNVSSQYHYSDEELPQQFKDEMWMPDTIGENWEVQLNDVILGDLSTTLNRNYYNASADQKIQIQVIIYENQFMYERKTYTDFTYLYEKEIAGTTMFYFERQEENEIEHDISFYQGTRYYRVHGNTAIETIEEIITEYAQVVFAK